MYTFQVEEPTGQYHPAGHGSAGAPGAEQYAPPGQGDVVGIALLEATIEGGVAVGTALRVATEEDDPSLDAESVGEADGAAVHERRGTSHANALNDVVQEVSASSFPLPAESRTHDGGA